MKTKAFCLVLLALFAINQSFGADVAIRSTEDPIDFAGGPQYPNLQAAIAAAAPGDTITLAPGVFYEYGQIVIDKDLTIVGDPAGGTILKPNHDTTVAGYVPSDGWIYVEPGVSFALENVTLDGTEMDDVTLRTIRHAIQSRGDLTVTNCTIKNIVAGTYYGRGILVLSGTNTITGCDFSNIQRIGIHVRGSAVAGLDNPVATITDCTYVGKGAIDCLDYAVEFGGGGSGSVSGCTFTDCTGVASVDGSTSGGILITDYYSNNGPTSATLTGNTITACSTGIMIGYADDDASTVEAHENNLAGNMEFGISSTPNASVNAVANWWGDASGPYHETLNASGTGSATETPVVFGPWYLDEAMTMLIPVCNETAGTCHMTIQDAINGAAEGDVIRVADGTYAEKLNINKGLSIIGQSTAGVIIDSSGFTGYAMYFTVDNVTLENFTLIGTPDSYGIKPSGCSNVTVSNVVIQNSYRTALDLNGVSGAAVSNVTIDTTTWGHGMSITDSNDISVENVSMSNIAWSSVGIATYGRYYPIGVTGVVFSGTNTFDTPVQIEMGNYSDPLAPELVTYSCDIADGADVTFQASEIGYALVGDQDDDYLRAAFFKTHADALMAVGMMPFGHFTGTGLSIRDLADGSLIVSPGMTIQAAVDAADPNDTIHIQAGTYQEQVSITTAGLSLIGEDVATVSITCPDVLDVSYTTSAANRAIVYIAGVDDVTLENITIDGLGKGNGNYRMQGVAYHEAGGTVESCVIKDVRETPLSGAQHGVALYAYVYGGTPRQLNVLNNEIYGYQKNAMALNGVSLTVNVVGNSTIGMGPTGITAQNGIQLYNATGLIQDNVTSGHYYTGEGWWAGGILLYDSTGTVECYGNSVAENNYGIQLYNGGSNGTCVIANNFIRDNIDGIDLIGLTEPYEVYNNSLTDNTGDGIWVDTAPAGSFVYMNNMSGNAAHGVSNGGPDLLYAANNYWGAADGPSGQGPGSGDAVTVNVDFSPWMLSYDDIVVDQGGRGDYTTIQAAIDAANPGDNIIINPGQYVENINIHKYVKLFGTSSDAGGTVITQTAAGAGDSKIGVVQLTASGASASEPILLQSIRIEPSGMAAISVGRFTEGTATLVENVKLDDVKIVGTMANPGTEQERGLYVDLTSSLLNLEIVDCVFEDLSYGWYFQKEVSADTSTVKFVTVTGTTFNHMSLKGIYAEKLSDATFTNCVVSNNAYSDAGVPSYFLPWMAGVDINLKAGVYENFVFDHCSFTDNALGGAKEGVALTVKGRGTGSDSSYASFPAIVDNVQVTQCSFTGNERGMRFGEPGKLNATPTNVAIHLCDIAGNVQQYTGTDGSAYGGVINTLLVDPSTLVDASDNYWGAADGPSGVGPGTGDAVTDNVIYDPYRTESFATADCPMADFNGDCVVDLQDFAVLASEWLVCGNCQ